MFLKTLSLAGFKSFADRTRLEFESGVNVVVGPNGSGKSNLLDALAWAMGTQATRSLRTERMEDVIFAGTTTRPALGRSEVTVTFDNADGFLPVDLAEISISRRLYRDGTSEYALNGTPCRLLDIQELLSDGGVGRHQHVLVGQGQIGDVLNARPDDHRAVIEEAAGVTKHRNRRDRALRRLEQTDVDVTRLEDILRQSRRRMRPLKRQADAADRHDEVRARLRALRLWLGGRELAALRARAAEAGGEKAGLDRTIADAERDREDLLHELDELRRVAGRAGEALQRDTAAAASLETSAERLQRIAMVARERRMSAESRLRGAGERRADLEQELADLRREIEAARAEEQTAAAMAERREAALTALDEEERTLAEQIQLPAESVVATMRGDLRSLEVAAGRDDRESKQVAQRVEVVRSRIENEVQELARLGETIENTDAEVAGAQDRYSTARSARERAQQAWEEAAEKRRTHRVAVERFAARVEAIEAALAGLADPAARERAAASDEVVGDLVSRLDVPAELAVAVDAVLGRLSGALMVRSVDGLAKVVENLKSAELGGVALVNARGPWSDAGAADAAPALGVDALVDRLGPASERVLADRLLGDVVVVDDWRRGIEIVMEHRQLRAVTTAGDVIDVDGVVVSEAGGAGRAALEAARRSLATAETEAARSDSRHVVAHREFEAARGTEREALEALEELEARLAGATEALGLVQRARSEGEAELDRLEERRSALAEAAVARQERLMELRRRVAEFEGEEAERQAAWEALNRRRGAVAAKRDEARRLRQAAAEALAGASERRRLMERRVDEAGAELESLHAHPVDPNDIARLEVVEARARASLEAVRRHVATLRERQRKYREDAGIADGRLEAAYQQQRELDRALSEGRERRSALEIELAELRVRDEATAEALRRDADATEQEALEAPMPELDEGEDATDVANTLEAELRRMGPVNPLAAAEYRELVEQVELLESQLADLAESRRELHKVVDALNEEMATLFMTAFDDISALFEENFGLVFPGGKGRLVLLDPNAPLTTGVEIEAQPLGKKVGRLSLLSGGERSLAALAFLFAVFRSRPSPFYVLDEVEAALDDANLRRFLRLVDTLRHSAQLVIITHQQQTMEAADVLYGVTMEPGESSKVIAKRMSDSRV